MENFKEKYLQKIMADFGMANAAPEEQKRVLEMASERFEDVIIQTMIRLMSPEQQKEFSQILDSPGKEGEVAKLAANIPNLDTEIEKALLAEYEFFKEGMKS